jgi:uncharacterized protein
MADYGPTLVAFSGGVDSAVVLAGAVRAVGAEQVIALTGISAAVPAAERVSAAEFAASLGVRHIPAETAEMDSAGYRENGPTRCAFCKTALLEVATEVAREHGMTTIVTGTNSTDVAEGFRPGISAAAQRGARTPLAEAGIGKAGVRAIAHHWHLPVWDKPAAACLSSRIAYGISITPARLHRVERAEKLLREALAAAGAPARDLRFRDLGDTARVEVDEDRVEWLRSHVDLLSCLTEAGFSGPVTVERFRSGAMNELLAQPELWR